MQHEEININGQKIDKDKLNQYIIGTSTKIEEYFKDVEPFVDLVVTSPPYYDAKVYSTIEDQIGYNQTYEEYLEDIRKTFQGVTKICKNTASLYLNIDTVKRDKEMYRLPDAIASILEDLQWVHQDTIIWDKVKTLPYSRKGQNRNVFEYILVFTKDKDNYKYYEDRIKIIEPMHWWVKHPEKYSPKGMAPSNIWRFSIPPQGSWGSKVKNEKEILNHACPFPPELMARIILLASDENDVVFDPYAGTGILLATANKLNRKYLGLDISTESKEIFNNAGQRFVNSKWNEIQGYYAIQDYLKPLYWKTIIDLRMLKYAKILMKKIQETKELVKSYDNILFCNVINEQMEQEEDKRRKKYAKAKYNIVYNGEIDIEYLTKELKSIISKKPFSKYSLITDIEFTDISKFIEKIGDIQFPLYIYENGEVTDYSKEIDAEYFGNRIMLLESSESSKQLTMGMVARKDKKARLVSKKYPLIISNIKICQADYKILLEETKPEERSKSYARLAKKYGLI